MSFDDDFPRNSPPVVHQNAIVSGPSCGAGVAADPSWAISPNSWASTALRTSELQEISTPERRDS